jgi:AcrR family transcriptional regulator
VPSVTLDAVAERAGVTKGALQYHFANKQGLLDALFEQTLERFERQMEARLAADHLEYGSEEGVAAMAKAGTVAVLLPGAFYFLGERRKPPVELFRRQRVPIAIASDCNPGSSPALSLLLMLNLGCTLFRLTPEEALAGVTREGARALGLAEDRGRLAPGLKADFVLWEIAHPAELAYWLGHNPAAGIVKDGEPVALDKHRFLRTDDLPPPIGRSSTGGRSPSRGGMHASATKTPFPSMGKGGVAESSMRDFGYETRYGGAPERRLGKRRALAQNGRRFERASRERKRERGHGAR